MQEVDSAQAAGLSRNEALEEELADASSAREVLALALARLLRDTKAHRLHTGPDYSSNPVAALEAQLDNLSVHDSKPSSPAQCNDFIASSLAVAHKILGTDPGVPAGAPCFISSLHLPVPVSIQVLYWMFGSCVP
jgi:hypothetical protein